MLSNNFVQFRTAFYAVVLGGLIAALGGCANGEPLQPLPPAPSMDQLVRLMPGDEVEVKFRYTPELDDRQMIRPDGKITLQVVDDVEVAGMTPQEADTKITQLFGDKLKDPEISVIVRSLANQRVYVGGEVLAPGLVEIRGRMTVLEAIMAAGGYQKGTARMENVIVVREVDGQTVASKVDLSKAFKSPQATGYYLAPRDVVLVPQTRIDEANIWVEQHINRLIPEGFLFTRTIGKSTVGYTSYPR